VILHELGHFVPPDSREALAVPKWKNKTISPIIALSLTRSISLSFFFQYLNSLWPSIRLSVSFLFFQQAFSRQEAKVQRASGNFLNHDFLILKWLCILWISASLRDGFFLAAASLRRASSVSLCVTHFDFKFSYTENHGEFTEGHGEIS
jgi:hypothetical protein